MPDFPSPDNCRNAGYGPSLWTCPADQPPPATRRLRMPPPQLQLATLMWVYVLGRAAWRNLRDWQEERRAHGAAATFAAPPAADAPGPGPAARAALQGLEEIVVLPRPRAADAQEAMDPNPDLCRIA